MSSERISTFVTHLGRSKLPPIPTTPVKRHWQTNIFASATIFISNYYKDFGFPPSNYTSIRYSFIQLLEDQTIPYLDDKQIINLPCLVDLKPETFVDWYSAMESELIMISNVDLLPFDAITINYQYVVLCIPGVGEKHIWRWLGYSIAPTTRQCHMSLTLWRMHSRIIHADCVMATSCYGILWSPLNRHSVRIKSAPNHNGHSRKTLQPTLRDGFFSFASWAILPRLL